MLRKIPILITLQLSVFAAVCQCTGGAFWVGGTPANGTLSASASVQGTVNVSVISDGAFASDRPTYANPLVTYNGNQYRYLRVVRGGARAWNNTSTTYSFSQALDSNMVHFRIGDVRGDGLNAETQLIQGYNNGVEVFATASNSINGGSLSGSQMLGDPGTTNSIQSSLRIHFNGPVDSVVISRASYGDYVILDMFARCLILLPFKLSEFNAHVQDGITQLTWKTSSASNFRNFIIERSSTGEQWKEIGQKEINTFSGAEKTYSFTDITPLIEKTYYRLKTIDNDGQVNYSKVVAVNYISTNRKLITVRGNSSFSEFKLNCSSDNIVLSIYSAEGKLINQQQISKGDLTISSSYWKPGIYYLRATDKKRNTETHKLVRR